MAGSTQSEIERKYDVDGAAAVPDLSYVDGVTTIQAREPVTLTAVYYDTDAADLARHRIALRRREGGGDAGWHIKKPADEGRTEFQWPLDVGADAEGEAPDSGAGAVPGEVLEPVRAIVRDRPLTPLARITTTRTVVRLLDAYGQPIAEVADDQVSASDIRGGGYRRWREWELELLEAAPATRKKRSAFLDTVERHLVPAGARPSDSPSKLARALGVESLTDLEAIEATRAPHPLAPNPLARGTAGSVVVTAIGELVDSLVASDPAVRSDETDAVHQMRRVVSQLRSVFRTYRRLFDGESVRRLLEALDRLADVLGEARDAEVRRSRAATELAALPVADEYAGARLVGGDRQAYADALARVRQLLNSEQYFRLLDALDDYVEAPALTTRASKPATGQVRKALRRQVKRLRRRADAALASDVDREAALHEARKTARRLVRAAAVVAPAVRSGQARAIRRITAAAKPIVTALGDHRDSRLFAEHLKIEAQRARAAGEDTFAYGMLLGRFGERADDDVLVALHDAVRAIEGAARQL